MSEHPHPVRSAREALLAELLGDVDRLLARVEALPQRIATAEDRLDRTAARLDEAGERFRLAITTFSAQARTELSDYLQRQAGQSAARAAAEQHAALQEAARAAFHALATSAPQATTSEPIRRTAATRLLEHGVTALIASLVSSAIVLVMMRGI